MLLHKLLIRKTIHLSIMLLPILNNLVIAEPTDENSDDDPTAVGASTARDCTDDYQIDLLKLVLTWGPGICSTKIQCLDDPAKDFTIHGFWPNFEGTKQTLRCCTKERYVEEKGVIERI